MGPLHHNFTASCPLFSRPSPLASRPCPSQEFCLCWLLLSGILFPRYGQGSLTAAVVCLEAVCSGSPLILTSPPPTVSINLPLVFFPHRGMTVWHSGYCTHIDFYLWSFPHLSVAPRGSRFWLFLFSTVFRVQGRSWYTVGAQYVFLNEWMKFHFLYSRRDGGGLKRRRKAEGGKPRQSAHLATGNSAEASGEKGIFQDRGKGRRRKMESQPCVWVCTGKWARVFGRILLCLWVEFTPKVQLVLGWRGASPQCQVLVMWQSSLTPHPPEWGARGPQADSNPGRLKSSRLPAEELSLQLLTWGWGKPASLISYGKSWAVFQLEPRIPGSFPSPSLQTVPYCNCASLGEIISTVTLSPTGNKRHQAISHCVSDALCYSGHSC